MDASGVWGPILGDISGSIYEGKPADDNDWYRRGAGCKYRYFTDDTVLTVATMDALLTDRDYKRAYLRWGKKYKHRGFSGRFIEWLDSDGQKNGDSYGNGSAMRVAPIGWAFDSPVDVLVEAERSAKTSHNHWEGIEGAQSIAKAVWAMRHGYAQRSVYLGCAMSGSSWFWDEIPVEMVVADQRGRPFSATCAGTVPFALRVSSENVEFYGAISLALSAGGDTDTIACMAGAIVGARHGVPAGLVQEARELLPKDMLKVIDRFERRYDNAFSRAWREGLALAREFFKNKHRPK